MDLRFIPLALSWKICISSYLQENILILYLIHIVQQEEAVLIWPEKGYTRHQLRAWATSQKQRGVCFQNAGLGSTFPKCPANSPIPSHSIPSQLLMRKSITFLQQMLWNILSWYVMVYWFLISKYANMTFAIVTPYKQKLYFWTFRSVTHFASICRQ